ncbi:hypothetical protein GCM10022216_14370 [Sphingobacterium kyonggiense]|uniref:Uncharacterized protein n=1 Tax=Sphingobacterium kyonggiense TaxID=714075 RepID=A0ABP7YL11_9SPHI
MNVICHIQNEMHREYLNAILAFEDGAFSVFRDTDIGRFICSMTKYSDFPIEQNIDPEKAVKFRLPRTSAMPSLFTRWCYIATEDQRRINDFLIAKFDQDFIQYYFVGINLGMKQKDVISNFILARKLISKIGDVEQLKKRTYRLEEKNMKKMVNRLARRVQIQNKIISNSILEMSQYQFS